jgi:ABC-type glycerol-3-phosphate transport system substrate-binding protein
MRTLRSVSILALAASLVAGACGPGTASPSVAPTSGATSGPTLDASPAATGQPYAGTTISVLAPDNRAFQWYGTQIDAFTAATGINVTYQNLPEASYPDQLTVKLTAKDASFDAFFYNARASHGFEALGGVAGLDDYIGDPALTPESYDYAGIPAAAQDICAVEGRTYCLNIHGGSIILFYNKDMLAAAGIDGPPQTTDELMDAALELKTPTQAGFCMRATDGPNVYPFTDIWNKFSPYTDNIKGTWFDAGWNPQINAATTVEAVTFYQQILTQAGPNGIANYSFPECLADMQQGKLAMWLDDASLEGSVEDETASTVAGKVGYSSIPCPPVNPDHCVSGAPYSGYINANAKNKEAAWLFLTYLTSPEMQEASAAAGVNPQPIRTATYDSAALAATAPADYLEAVQYALGHLNGAYKVLAPEEGEISAAMGLALSRVVSGQAEPADALSDANETITDVVTKAGYLQ